MPEVFQAFYAIFEQDADTRLDIQRLTPGYRVFFEGRSPVTIQGNLDEDARTFEAIEAGAGSKLRKYIKKSAAIYNVATNDFLYSNFERPFRLIAKHVWLLASTTLVSLDHIVSRYFKSHYLKKILQYQAVFLGNSPYQLPGIYSLMSKLDFESGVFYPARGMPSLVDDLITLADNLPITFHFNTPVASIAVERGATSGIVLSDGTVITSDIVISNADLHHTETQLLDPKYQTYPESYWKKRQPSPGGLVISLGIKGSLPQLPHHSLLFADDWKANFDAIYKNKRIPEKASLYVCNPSKSDPSLAPAGYENLFILAPLPAGISIDTVSLDSIAQRYIQQCAEKTGIDDLEQRIVTRNYFSPDDFSSQYNAWQHNAFAGESHLLSQSALFRTRNKSKKVANLYYVGAGTLPGVGLPMCLISAQQTFKRIVGITKDGPLTPVDVENPHTNE